MKKIITVIISVFLIFGLVGCGNSKEASKNQDKKTIVVGATPVPHAEILEKIKPILEKKGYKLEIKIFNDYVIPNTALNDGELDANFFQHIPYLNKFNSEKGTKLDYTVKVHLEPMGLYSNKIKKIDQFKNNVSIAIPKDPTNGSRALRLLENEGLIKLKKGELVTKFDIIENKLNLKIQELDAPQLPRALNDVDAAVINTNYALQANLNPTKDAIAIESKDSPYANILVVKKENKDKSYIKVLSEALNSKEIKEFIKEKYKGSIIPAF
ncbi:MetQ/NlpA family ABC transporter substrate-binding protein [Haloimpatiens sp. FM7330]|uniref:MetQ/NlpA family ABC transporter substrate-binding protein n=1 Tax=Haloimpatiens sp. FM7330 TaxID=3298610 RepID=UPI003633A66B